jgi:15-cis-phytoene synthase
MDANFRHCAGLVQDVHHDAYLAALFAPAGKRAALFALYAFNIEVSRVRDLAREPMPGEIRLQWWRETILGERPDQAAANPVAAAFRETIAKYNLRSDIAAALIAAHRFDIYDEPMATLSELQSYSAETAGTVFAFAVEILTGHARPIVADLLGEAGQAFVIANILGQLPHHAARRQLYLPLETLRRHGADPEEIFAMRATPQLRAVLAELRLRARRSLARLGEVSCSISEDAWPAFLPLAPLRPWLATMERADYDPFQPPEMARWRRQWHIWWAAKSIRRIGG